MLGLRLWSRLTRKMLGKKLRRAAEGVAARVFSTLAEEGVNIEMIATSPIKISCVIDRSLVPRAVQVLHAAFELAGAGTSIPE